MEAGLFDLKGQVAMITGSGQGLGQSMALGMAQYGADVVAVDVDVARAEDTAHGTRRLVQGTDRPLRRQPAGEGVDGGMLAK